MYPNLESYLLDYRKNLGPAGLALVIIREDLLNHALPETPMLLNYKVYEEQHSLANTNNTFAIYMMSLVLDWLKKSKVAEKNRRE